MTDTPLLALPYIEAAQAQKHVTHNEALRILDTLVQLAVLDRDLSAPPGSPAAGERFIVKPAATGDWTGQENAIAAWQDGAWQFSAPRTGWVAFVIDEGTLVVWNGTAWVDFFAAVTTIQNLALLGVGTHADATNPFSAKLNNALWVARTVAEGGDGHLRYKLSKESAARTLSLLLQDNFSGRAEFGLIGDDDLLVKVSADGTAWQDAMRIARSTGNVAILPGTASTSAATGALTIAGGLGVGGAAQVAGAITAGTYGRIGSNAAPANTTAGDLTAGRLFTGSDAVALTTRSGGSTVVPCLQATGTSAAASGALCARFVNSVGAPGQYFLKGRVATVGDPTIVQSNDVLGFVSFAGMDGVQATEAARLDARVTGTPAANALTGEIRLLTSSAGIAPAARMTVDATVVAVLPTTAATSATTGALTVAGGLGLAGAAHVGGALNVGGCAGFGIAASSAAWVKLAAGTSSVAQLNLPVSTAPSAPADGDIWREDNTNTGLKIRVNGVTKTITLS